MAINHNPWAVGMHAANHPMTRHLCQDVWEADPRTECGGRPVGVTIVGAEAGELVALWSVVLANRLKLAAVANMVAPYPTLGEIGKRAAGAYFAPRLFDNGMVKRVVGLVQRILP